VLRLAGVDFRIRPEDRRTPAERALVERLGRSTSPRSGVAEAATAFEIEMVSERPFGSDEPWPAPAPAAVSWEEGRVRLRQHGFVAEIDAPGASARLYRRTEQAFALEVTLRAALSCRLPLVSGLPLHAAGVVSGGKGLVFHGPSGAGKSTLAAAFPGPVVSDELVAVAPERHGTPAAGWLLHSTGFFGTHGLAQATAAPAVGPVLLAALVELDRGPFHLERVDSRRALVRLALATMVPPAPPLWSVALGVIGRLVREVPCYRMAWSPDDSPFARLAEVLRL
jgi:hypothetical protein